MLLTQKKRPYFLGFLYADGYNNTDRYTVNLSLKEGDKDILVELNNLIQPTKPLQYVTIKQENASNQYRLVIANKHISTVLAQYGCMKAKTFKIEFPQWLQQDLIPHFIRGYFDGDGYVGQSGRNWNICIVGTYSFCETIQGKMKSIGINSFFEVRHPERKHNIVQLRFSGRQKVKLFYDYLYTNATIFLKRKHDAMQLSTVSPVVVERLCSVEGCHKKHSLNGFCRNHNYEFNDGAAKRRAYYINQKSSLN